MTIKSLFSTTRQKFLQGLAQKKKQKVEAPKYPSYPEYIIHLDNLHEATAQQVFDQGAQHLLAMEEPCTDSEAGGCVYRDGCGNACVGGCFITNKQYRPEFEDVANWLGLVESDKSVPEYHKDLINALQSVHDAYAFINEEGKNFRTPYIRKELVAKLRNVANQFNVEYKTYS